MTSSDGGRFTKIVGAIVNPVVGSVDMDGVLENVDLNELLARVDLDEVLARLDINSLLDRIDIDRLLNRVDVDGIVKRVDVNEIVSRVDVDDIIGRVDVDGIISRVDINALLERADINAILQRTKIGSVVTDSAGTVATSALDLGRRQAAGLDTVVGGLVGRLFRRDAASVADPGVVDDKPAGAVTRLAAYAIDAVVVASLFSLGVSVLTYLVELFVNHDVNRSTVGRWWFAGGALGFAAVYQWFCLVIAGRTVGKGVMGLRVLRGDHQPLTARAAFIRCLIYPFSFVFGIGLVGIVLGKDRRALHDVGAHTVVVYDWGDRVARVPAPLERYLARRNEAA